MNNLYTLPVWKKLKTNYNDISEFHLREIFENDPNRFEKFSVNFNGILLDYSKNRIDSNTMQLLFELAKESGLEQSIENMFSGKKINFTEKREVLHTALRNRVNKPVYVDGFDVMPKVNAVLHQMREFVENIHSGKWRGCTGKEITDVVNIGIGGSDLGPAMVCEALKAYSVSSIKVHFVSNVDSAHILETLKQLNPETTLFIISSKTFTTQETLSNAYTAKMWFTKSIAKHESDVAKHFVAISTNETAVKQFGIDPVNMFVFWNWVGGRYSLWSAIGLSIALYVGMENFEKLLTGAFMMDNHFKETAFDNNIPVIMGLLNIWYADFFMASSYAVIPYSQYLCRLPDYLQQLIMESNGKSVNAKGESLPYPTSPVIWGSAGTNAQHSFFQLLHQGTQIIPTDFLAAVEPVEISGEHHQMLLSNFFAQTEALMRGKTKEEALAELIQMNYSEQEISLILPHKVFPGNKPTNTILFPKLTPEYLGSILAMYEHSTFVQGAIWNINSFDQWGVELGKQLANNILPELQNEDEINSHDCSTNSLINYYKKTKKK